MSAEQNSNAPLLEWNGAFFLRGLAWLEDDFATELCVEGLAGADAGSAVVVADGVKELRASADRSRRRSEVVAIEEVEELGAKLNGDALGDLGVLEDREINIAETGSVEGITTGCAKGADGGVSEGRKIDPVRCCALALIADTSRGNLDGAIVAFVGPADVA